jgi:hypothetical protein
MSVRILLAIIFLAVIFLPCDAQPPVVVKVEPSPTAPQPVPVAPSILEPPLIEPTPRPSIPTPPPTIVVPLRTLDQLLDEFEFLRKQKAELEKKEEDLKKAILKKAGEQTERMKRLQITLTPPPANPPLPELPPEPVYTIPAPQSLPQNPK